MPTHEHLVLCGGTAPPHGTRSRPLRLSLHGPNKNVRLQIADIRTRLVTNIPDVLVDLLEVASYVYAADSAITRGGPADEHLGARWRRSFRFIVPVRHPDLWSSDAVSSALTKTLGFLSDDDYAFTFCPAKSPAETTAYFELTGDLNHRFSPDEVILFSGGLDSFAGTVETLCGGDNKIALVSHRSAHKISKVQQDLVNRLSRRLPPGRLIHVPIRTNLKGSVGRELTHRARSFLFAALGTAVARLCHVDGIKFFENGILSMNLPPVAQVVGARATRTTHPQVLHGFEQLVGALLGQRFGVANPYLWLTKAEVVARIEQHDFGDLIRDTRSCTRVRDMIRLHPHCGRCSQCLDRRFAVIAAGVEHEDPPEAYGVDLFTGERSQGRDQEMALAFVRMAGEIRRMGKVAFFSRFGELSRILPFIPESPDVAAGRIFDLHKRHAAAVCEVFDEAINRTPRICASKPYRQPACSAS